VSVVPADFARLAGEGVRVVVTGGGGDPGAPGVPGVSELVAEAALLQARLDWFQAQLARLGERGFGGGGVR
jgi:hypothetical protein